MKQWLPILGLVLIAACAGSPAPGGTPVAAARAATVDPVGTYDFNTIVEGSPVTGTIVIRREGNAYGGTITTTVSDPIVIGEVSVEGMRVRIAGEAAEGPLEVLMDFAGDEFTGTWTLGSLSGTHAGRRRTG